MRKLNFVRALFLTLLLALSFVVPQALAVEPSEVLDDPVLEARAREISKDLRCVVCQNQDIDSSNADLARDMRVLVRDRLLAGDSNKQVLDYMVSRYGDFVLLDPPLKTSTYALWYGPGLIVVLGLFGVVMFFRRRSESDPDARVATEAPPVALSDDEQKRFKKILKGDTE